MILPDSGARTVAPGDRSVIMRGAYRDTFIDVPGKRTPDPGWRRNVIVGTCWPLMTGLLKNDPDLRGILYWAVGEGVAEWDDSSLSGSPGVSSLRSEVGRIPIDPEAMVYLDAAGEPSVQPTPRLEVRARFEWSADQVLREFGIFGGDASEDPDSGQLINYVVHDRLDMAAGSALERQIRFSFRREGIGRWLDPADHWLGTRPVGLIDGVGEAFAAALAEEGIESIDDLARCEPINDRGTVPLIPLVELRSKARLALRVASEIRVPEAFHARTAWDVLVTPTATLALDAGTDEDEASWLREKIGALELSLNHRFLSRITVGELMSHGRGEG